MGAWVQRRRQNCDGPSPFCGSVLSSFYVMGWKSSYGQRSRNFCFPFTYRKTAIPIGSNRTMAYRTTEDSQRIAARVAGFTLLLLMVSGFAGMYVHSGHPIVAGDAAATIGIFSGMSERSALGWPANL
jgi:hypothetical protein